MSKPIPSMDQWLKEAKAHESAPKIGMYLTHNGIVRQSAKAKVRYGEDAKDVTGMVFSYDQEKVDAVLADARNLEGIYYIRLWLNEGELKVGDDVVVSGCGSIGLSVIQTAKLAGACRVIAFDPVPQRRKLAAQAGADFVFDPTDEASIDEAKALDLMKQLRFLFNLRL